MGKAVIVLSTMHRDTATDGDAQKPEIILHYNSKKRDVDNMDHLATLLTFKRKINRWSMVLFFNMLDVAGVAAFMIWVSFNPEWATNDENVWRRKFLKQIGYDLTDDWIQHCIQNVHIMQPLVKTALKVLGKIVGHPQPAREAGHQIRKRCPVEEGTRKHQLSVRHATDLHAPTIHPR